MDQHHPGAREQCEHHDNGEQRPRPRGPGFRMRGATREMRAVQVRAVYVWSMEMGTVRTAWWHDVVVLNLDRIIRGGRDLRR